LLKKIFGTRHRAAACRLGRLRKRAQFHDPIAFLSNRPLRALFSSVSRAALHLNPALQRRPGRVKGSRQRRDRVNIVLMEQFEAGFELSG